jgi:hypothetical protein
MLYLRVEIKRGIIHLYYDIIFNFIYRLVLKFKIKLSIIGSRIFSHVNCFIIYIKVVLYKFTIF